MRTVYLAVEGSTPHNMYAPIEKGVMDVYRDNADDAYPEAVSSFAKLRKFDKNDFQYTDDHKIVAQARAWGYEEPWINSDGYVIFVGSDAPLRNPDPTYAYWLGCRDNA